MSKVNCEYCGETISSSMEWGSRCQPFDDPLWHPCPEAEKAKEKYKDLWHYPAVDEHEGAGGSRDKPHGGTNKGDQPGTGLLITSPPLSLAEAVEIVRETGTRFVDAMPALRVVLDAAEALDEARRTKALESAANHLVNIANRHDGEHGRDRKLGPKPNSREWRTHAALLRRLNGEQP